MISRREFLGKSVLAGAAALGMQRSALAVPRDLHGALALLERTHGGRLGAAILNSAGVHIASYRGTERFAMCSTSKFLVVASILARVDRGEQSLSRRIPIMKSDLVAHSPITERHVGARGLSVGELCEAAITVSDNAALNILLDTCGGPHAVTAFIRSLGDAFTRCDRREPELNDVDGGDTRDTTTPVAMLKIMRTTLLGNALFASSRAQMVDWLRKTITGAHRLRAGVPSGWQVGDKTGTGPHAVTNDIGIIQPPGRAPILVTAYYTGSKASPAQRDAVLAAVGRLAANTHG